MQTDQWIRSLFIGQNKDTYIYSAINQESTPDDIEGFHIRITKNNVDYYWNIAYDGHIYFGGSKVI